MIGLAAAALGAACPEQSDPRVDEIVYSWMQCQECRGEQEARVVALRDTALPPLRAILQTGPPQAHVDRVVALIREVGRRAPPAPSNEAIALEVAGLKSLYRVRAAHTLAAIGGTGARQALCDARSNSAIVGSARAEVDAGIAQLGGACP